MFVLFEYEGAAPLSVVQAEGLIYQQLVTIYGRSNSIECSVYAVNKKNIVVETNEP